MSDIDWSKAPEGATHRVACGTVCPWRKLTDRGDFWHDGDEWRSLKRGPADCYIARPTLTAEPDWSEAPEGATHYSPGATSNGVNPWRKRSAGKWLCWVEANARWQRLTDPLPDTYIPRPSAKLEAHADDLAVDAFARAMSAKLDRCRAAGKFGWDDPEQCPPQRLAEGLVRAVRAGKLVDVGNYAMMLWKRAEAEGWARQAPAAWLKVALAHREPVEWNGTGLPPAGTVCECKVSGSLDWEPVTIAANVTSRAGNTLVLFERDHGRGWCWEGSAERLRPILTPEQRAAKERDEAVAAMVEVTGLGHVQTMAVGLTAQALYDVGYRKTEVK